MESVIGARAFLIISLFEHIFFSYSEKRVCVRGRCCPARQHERSACQTRKKDQLLLDCLAPVSTLTSRPYACHGLAERRLQPPCTHASVIAGGKPLGDVLIDGIRRSDEDTHAAHPQRDDPVVSGARHASLEVIHDPKRLAHSSELLLVHVAKADVAAALRAQRAGTALRGLRHLTK